MVSSFLLNSCQVLDHTTKQELSDSYYTKIEGTEKSKVYVDINNDLINIYPLNHDLEVDTTKDFESYQLESASETHVNFILQHSSFDLDFMTIPLKYRFSTKDLPAQLNTDLNGGLFIGFRTDRYHINYSKNPLGKSIRNINHWAYSVGLYTGLGNTQMTPTNTNDQIQQEYDGVVWSKGIVGIIGFNRFTMGITLGFDQLLDKNRNLWIY